MTLGTGPTSRTEEVEFYVVNVQYVYNAILKTPAQASFDVVISVPHQRVKFPTKQRIGMEISHLKNKKMSSEKGEGTSAHITFLEKSSGTSSPQEYEEIILHMSYPEQKVKFGRSLSSEESEQLKDFLIQHKDNFAWCTSDMPGINSKVVEHRLNIDPTFIPIQQKLRSFKDEKEVAMNEEVGNLLQAKFI